MDLTHFSIPNIKALLPCSLNRIYGFNLAAWMVRSDAGPCISGPATVGLAGDGDLGQSSQQPVSQETQALRSETLMSPDNYGE